MRIAKDEKAVALTEFCIVIPVLLFLFLAVLQYFQFVRAAQMVNYAAYVAARSYAVLHDQSKAKRAAVMALAPVSNNLGIESLTRGLGGGMSDVSDFFNKLAGGIPGGQSAARYANGLLSAYASLSLGNFRLTTNSLPITRTSSGGSFSQFVGGLAGGSPWQSPSSVPQVNVSINYPQFINVPGFAGLWKFLAGNDPFASLEYYYQTYLWSKGLPSEDLIVAFLVAEGCVNIPAKCSTGYELWGARHDYQEAVNNLKTYTSTFSQNDWDPGNTKWIPRRPSRHKSP